MTDDLAARRRDLELATSHLGPERDRVRASWPTCSTCGTDLERETHEMVGNRMFIEHVPAGWICPNGHDPGL